MNEAASHAGGVGLDQGAVKESRAAELWLGSARGLAHVCGLTVVTLTVFVVTRTLRTAIQGGLPECR